MKRSDPAKAAPTDTGFAALSAHHSSQRRPAHRPTAQHFPAHAHKVSERRVCNRQHPLCPSRLNASLGPAVSDATAAADGVVVRLRLLLLLMRLTIQDPARRVVLRIQPLEESPAAAAAGHEQSSRVM